VIESGFDTETAKAAQDAILARLDAA